MAVAIPSHQELSDRMLRETVYTLGVRVEQLENKMKANAPSIADFWEWCKDRGIDSRLADDIYYWFKAHTV